MSRLKLPRCRKFPPRISQEDLKAQKAVLFLWEEGASKKKIRFSPKFILNMRGYRSIRQRFLIEI